MIRGNFREAFIFGKSSDNLSIQIGSDGLRIAYTRQRGLHREVVDVAGYEIAGLKEEDIAQRINQFIKSTKIKVRTSNVNLVIPAHLAITKNIEIPSSDPKEIADIMNLQAARHTPYSREEIIIDYKVLGVYRANYTKVLLVIVTREVVHRQMNIVSKAGIGIERICFASEAAGKFISELFKISGEEFPTGLLHIDRSFSYFNIVFGGASLFTRSIPIGIQHLDEDYTRYASQFVEEMKKSLDVYRSEDIESVPQRILLLMPTNKYKGLSPFLTNTLGISAENVPFLEHLFLREKVRKMFSTASPSVFLDVIASSFESKNTEINLIPEEIKLKRAFEEKSRQILWMGFFSFSIIVVIFILIASKIAFRSIYLDKLKERSEVIHKEAKVLEEEFRNTQFIKRFLAKRGRSLEVIDRIYKNIPSKVSINDVRFVREMNSLSIKGTADSMTTIYSFVEDLSKDSLFSEVKTRYTSKRKEGDREVADFELGIKISNTEGE